MPKLKKLEELIKKIYGVYVRKDKKGRTVILTPNTWVILKQQKRRKKKKLKKVV